MAECCVVRGQDVWYKDKGKKTGLQLVDDLLQKQLYGFEESS